MGGIDPFLGRRRTPDYTCLHLARDVWLSETGQDLADRLPGLFAAHTAPRLTRREIAGFDRLNAPQSPCLAVMSGFGPELHIGIFVRGRIIHLTRRSVEFMEPDVAVRGHSKVRFYQ